MYVECDHILIFQFSSFVLTYNNKFFVLEKLFIEYGLLKRPCHMEKNDEETWSYWGLGRPINLGSCMICQEIFVVFFVDLVDDTINN